MEEKQIKKSNSKGLYVIIIVLLIAVIGMGLFIAYDKGVIFNKTTNDDKQNNNVVDKKESEETTEVVNKLSEEETMQIGKELWDYAYGTYWGKDNVFTKHLSETVNEYGAKYYICDTTIEQVKAKYASDFKAQSCLIDDNPCADYTINDFINTYDGYVICDGAQRGEIQTYKETNLTIKDVQADKIVFTATSAYCARSFCMQSDETVKEIKKDFIIKKENDNWVISYFYLPN